MTLSAGPLNGNRFDHVVLTRFNVPLSGQRRGVDPTWLSHRFDLFERWCLPSIRSQTRKNFRWLVFFDERTPSIFKSRAAQLSRDTFEPVWIDDEYTPALVLRHLRPREEWLATTRLDNDDALAPWFVERLQARMAQRITSLKARGEVFSFPVGRQHGKERDYYRLYLNNPFITLLERSAEARTVFNVQHWNLRAENAHMVWTRPAWLQVVHSDNLANEIRGIRSRSPGESRIELLGGQIHDAASLARKVVTPAAMARVWGALSSGDRRD